MNKFLWRCLANHATNRLMILGGKQIRDCYWGDKKCQSATYSKNSSRDKARLPESWVSSRSKSVWGSKWCAPPKQFVAMLSYEIGSRRSLLKRWVLTGVMIRVLEEASRNYAELSVHFMSDYFHSRRPTCRNKLKKDSMRNSNSTVWQPGHHRSSVRLHFKYRKMLTGLFLKEFNSLNSIEKVLLSF